MRRRERLLAWLTLLLCLCPSAAPARSEVMQAWPEPEAVRVRATGDVYVRTAPDAESNYLGVLWKDEEVAFMVESAWDKSKYEWYKVSFEGETGWVFAGYAALTDGGASDLTFDEKSAAEALVALDDASLRAGPSLDADVLAIVRAGDRVTGTGIAASDGVWIWKRVRYGDAEGYVASRFLGAPEE